MLRQPITAIVLAGGKSRRMEENNKGLQLLSNKPLYCHVIDQIKPQVDIIIISANNNLDDYKQSGYTVVQDKLSGFLGPLAGIYSGLSHSKTDWALIVSCDTPFLPKNLVQRLWLGAQGHVAAYVNDGEKDHPTILLIHTSQMENIANYLQNGDRKLMLFLNSIKAAVVSFSDNPNAFININTLDELAYWNKKQ